MFKKILVGGAAAAAIAAAGIAGAGPANAAVATIGSRGDYNPYNYRDELRYSGLYHEDVSNAAELGPRICRQRFTGYTEDQLIDSLVGPDPLYTTEQAVEIVLGAEYHFCPGYEHDGSVGAGPSAPWPAPPPPPPGYYSSTSQSL
jgi:hypothetical protein